MHYVIIGLDYLDTSEIRQQTTPKHLEYLQREHAGVTVAMAGPLLARDGETVIGSMIVIDARDEQVAERFAAGEPYRKAGLFAELTIRRWCCTRANPKAE